MISIDDVLADRFFYHMAGITQAAGKTTSQMIWNPEDSGVNVAIRQAFTYSAPYTAVNYKSRTSPFGTQTSPRNSMAMKNPTSAQGKSKAVACFDKIGSTLPQNDPLNYVLFPVDRNPAWDLNLAVPVVLCPGTGIIVYPDTTIAMQWTWSVVWEEQPIVEEPPPVG
jgi:hypothetical protein